MEYAIPMPYEAVSATDGEGESQTAGSGRYRRKQLVPRTRYPRMQGWRDAINGNVGFVRKTMRHPYELL